MEHPDWPGDLRRPKWPLYLGRKACVPTRPVLDRLAEEYQDLECALNKEAWAAPRSVEGHRTSPGARPAPKLTAWVECPGGAVERQDALRLNQLRFYDFRRCRLIEIDAGSLPRRSP
ncbi:MAG: hypothetical protein HYX94_05840 [Chloroflexi bacterium]|nr:hypothetical protein [Chloroflexota bacterium]